MSPPADQIAEEDAGSQPRNWRMALQRAGLLFVILLLAGVVLGWVQREQIARDLIGEQLDGLGLPVSYDISDISTDRQILENIVVGDPARPDLTIERVEVSLEYGLGIPEIGRLTVVKPRLYGSYKSGKLSFGSLDDLLFDETKSSPGLPALDIKLVDGRGLIDSDYGAIGFKTEGEGRLDGGFTGIFAAVAPELRAPECRSSRATAFGKIALQSDSMDWTGPIRLAGIECNGVSIGKAEAETQLSFASDFSSVNAQMDLAAGGLTGFGATLGKLQGDLKMSLADERFVADLDLSAKSFQSAQVDGRSLALDGTIRSDAKFSNPVMTGTLNGQGISPGGELDRLLSTFEQSADGTLAAPLLGKLRKSFATEVRNADLSADFTARRSQEALSLVVPEAAIRGANGGNLLAISQLQFSANGNATPRISGNFRTGGVNLPKLVGRMEQSGGNSLFRLRMDEYSAADSRLAIPEMVVTQNSSGGVGFAGSVLASGELPGGKARGLKLPVDGNWSAAGGLSLWRKCTAVSFDSLAAANLTLNSRRVTLCPARGTAIVRQNGAGLKIAAGLASLDLDGMLAGTPIAVKSGPIGFAYPGVATAKQVEIALGPKAEPSRFVISDLLARLGSDISGEFSGADIRLAAVPLNLEQTTGQWGYRGGVLDVSDAGFTLTDRTEVARFEPLLAQGATLRLADNVISANADIMAPDSRRIVTEVAIVHNLGTGTGFADLDVNNLVFDDSLQPDELSYLALGVLNNVQGVVRGKGRIDWNSETVTSSGAFSSDSLDLAAVFGPVEGASGTIEFVDLLNLTTAPDQMVSVKSINPGIEARDGVIGFSLRDGQFLGVTGGKWPFMGGTLVLEPVSLNLGIAEKRRYVLEVEGVDAALFVANMDMPNLVASGIFDGQLPIEFDEEGFGRIVGGKLVSRAPGGNVSYIGELTYEDLSPMANYAFSTLRSLDYTSMTIEMEGALIGDIVTKVKFYGVKQGAGTKQNFITRQIANLPIRFDVNIRAPFFQLFGSLRSLYDPNAVADPRSVGLVDSEGRAVIFNEETRRVEPLETQVPDLRLLQPDESPIQPSDSEKLP